MKKTYNIRKAIFYEEKPSPGSIPRAAKILACLCGNINSVSEIAKESRLPKSTVHRILKLMEESALVTENPMNRRYYIGPLITRLATNPITMHEYLIRCVLDEMKYIARVSEEMVALDILFGIQIVPLYEIPSVHDIRIIDSNQKLGPLYIGAGAKVLLSQLSEEQLRIVLKYVNIPRITERTVVEKNVLIAQIEDIRKNGYAVSYGERSPGGLCLAVPIHNYTSPASLSVIGLESRLEARKEITIRELRNVSIRLSQKVSEIYRLKK